MYVRVPSFESVMSVTMGHTKDGVSYVEDQVYRMPITVKNAQFKKKTGTDVQKL